MNVNKTIFKSLVALIVIMLGVNFNAEAQIGLLGGLVDKATEKSADIPKAKKKGKPIVISKGKYGIGQWDPTTLELTFFQKYEEGALKGQQIILKIDPNTGAITDKAGGSKGSMQKGSLETLTLGSLTVKKKDYPWFTVSRNGEVIGQVSPRAAFNMNDLKLGNFEEEVSPLLVAYVFFGALMSEEQLATYKAGLGDKITTAELEDKIEWTDNSTIREIMEFESSRPYAGWDREQHPELKNCKVAAVGLLDSEWGKGSNVVNSKTQYYYPGDWYAMKYYAVYELADGRNIAMTAIAMKEYRYGDIKVREHPEFNEITDWVRK
jgi:hypothetical protein